MLPLTVNTNTDPSAMRIKALLVPLLQTFLGQSLEVSRMVELESTTVQSLAVSHIYHPHPQGEL